MTGPLEGGAELGEEIGVESDVGLDLPDPLGPFDDWRSELDRLRSGDPVFGEVEGLRSTADASLICC